MYKKIKHELCPDVGISCGEYVHIPKHVVQKVFLTQCIFKGTSLKAIRVNTNKYIFSEAKVQ